MKQAENVPVDTNKPGMQPNAPPMNEQEKAQHRDTESAGKDAEAASPKPADSP